RCGVLRPAFHCQPGPGAAHRRGAAAGRVRPPHPVFPRPGGLHRLPRGRFPFAGGNFMSASQVQQEPFISNALPSREETQAKLDLRSVAASRIKPTQEYTLADRLEAQVDRFSDRDFLVYGGQRFSYREVDERANQYASTFLARGIQPGDVCAMAMENRPDFFFCWFGLAKIGAVTAFINYHLKGRALLHALESTAARAVVIGEECLDGFLETEQTADYPRWLVADSENPIDRSVLPVSLDQGFHDEVLTAPRVRPDAALRAGIKAEDDMLYIFTSGTTG